MRRAIRSVLGPSTVLTLLLSGLSLAAPAYNAQEIAPRAVFLHLPAELAEPKVTLHADALEAGRWRITLEAVHFTFTDICLTEAEARPIGHAHVMLDGKKIASAYQPVVELGPLPPGRHVLRVVLRGQDHRALLGVDGLIEASITVTVP